jgi:hypothetical protein
MLFSATAWQAGELKRQEINFGFPITPMENAVTEHLKKRPEAVE